MSKCPYYVYYQGKCANNFETIAELEKHLDTHEKRFIARTLAELIYQIEELEK